MQVLLRAPQLASSPFKKMGGAPSRGYRHRDAGRSLPLALSRFAANLSAERAIEVLCQGELERLHLSLAQADHLYRIAQECLRYAATHPDCRKIEFELLSTQENLILTTAAEAVATDTDAEA